MRQVTSGSERRICSRSRRLKTIEHCSIHQQRIRFAIHLRPALSTTKLIANGHNTNNFSPLNPQQQFLGSCKQKQSTKVSVSCNNMARSIHIKSTLSYFCQPDPLPDPCCRSITTLPINLLRGETEPSIYIDALVLWPLMHQSCFDSAAVR